MITGIHMKELLHLSDWLAYDLEKHGRNKEKDGHTSNHIADVLTVEGDKVEVRQSRMTVADGAKHDDMIEIYVLSEETWNYELVKEYKPYPRGFETQAYIMKFDNMGNRQTLYINELMETKSTHGVFAGDILNGGYQREEIDKKEFKRLQSVYKDYKEDNYQIVRRERIVR